MVLSALHDSLHHSITISNWNIQSRLSHQARCSVAPDWTSYCTGCNTRCAIQFIHRLTEKRRRDTGKKCHSPPPFKSLCVRGTFKCVPLNIVSRYPARVGGLIDWCWFHLGSESQLTEDLSRCERQPLILVLFKQHVLICVIFTKSAREEHLPSYVWLFVEFVSVSVYVCVWNLGKGLGLLPHNQHFVTMQGKTIIYILCPHENCILGALKCYFSKLGVKKKTTLNPLFVYMWTAYRQLFKNCNINNITSGLCKW